MLTNLFLALAAVASTPVLAAPQSSPPPPPPPPPPSSYQTPPSKPLSNAEFGLIMRVPVPNGNPTSVALVATQNGTNPELLLVGQRPAAFTGTPAYTNNTQPPTANGFDYVALNLDVDGSSYGLFAADVGSVYGIATTINAVKGWQQEEWLVSDKYSSINRKLAAANNLFLACERTVNGEPATVLSWGIYYSNGSAPAGCRATSVEKNCNVPESTAQCPQD
ncbi:hypothetical protein CERZMDRAFT_95428 [Cercospora zeae-maydis SCOH1-5]|uniref:Uncharacterized protein n=1 Tax=Cercospora zeae-maydis SCOH1-5 TaxID=717836 RepID=A0A6A6FNK5_9PEZI|nr:hypothetical protein CERZMDRAFT_95428 [Cercospora zeae-maydis SCOH1-5]